MDSQISLNDVNFVYNSKTPLASQALFDVNLNIQAGEFVSIVGQTGSGKSTLVQLINALLRPTSGTVTVDGFQISSKTNNKNLSKLRKKVGMVFQFPEKQLFEETVLKDVEFGPNNFGVDKTDCQRSAEEALKLVGLDTDLYGRSPFDLSGGQMRRVAIAGVLAVKPEVLILDEPTVGLDPAGQRDIMKLVRRLNENGTTIILVSHDMDVVAEYSDRVVVMSDGHIGSDESPRELFANQQFLKNHSLGLPDTVKIYFALKDNGVQLNEIPLTKAEIVSQIRSLKNGGESH